MESKSNISEYLTMNSDWEPGMILAEKCVTDAIIWNKYGLICKKSDGFSMFFVRAMPFMKVKTEDCVVAKDLRASFEQLNLLIEEPGSSTGNVRRIASKRKSSNNQMEGNAAKSARMETEVYGDGISRLSNDAVRTSKRKLINGNKNETSKKIRMS